MFPGSPQPSLSPLSRLPRSQSMTNDSSLQRVCNIVRYRRTSIQQSSDTALSSEKTVNSNIATNNNSSYNSIEPNRDRDSINLNTVNIKEIKKGKRWKFDRNALQLYQLFHSEDSINETFGIRNAEEKGRNIFFLEGLVIIAYIGFSNWLRYCLTIALHVNQARDVWADLIYHGVSIYDIRSFKAVHLKYCLHEMFRFYLSHIIYCGFDLGLSERFLGPGNRWSSDMLVFIAKLFLLFMFCSFFWIPKFKSIQQLFDHSVLQCLKLIIMIVFIWQMSPGQSLFSIESSTGQASWQYNSRLLVMGSAVVIKLISFTLIADYIYREKFDWVCLPPSITNIKYLRYGLILVVFIFSAFLKLPSSKIEYSYFVLSYIIHFVFLSITFTSLILINNIRCSGPNESRIKIKLLSVVIVGFLYYTFCYLRTGLYATISNSSNNDMAHANAEDLSESIY